MNRISRCDWLPERARWSHLARSGYGLCPASTQIMLWCFIPYNKSFIDQACSVKMAGYWPRSLLRIYGVKHAKKELDRASLVNNPYVWQETSATGVLTHWEPIFAGFSACVFGYFLLVIQCHQTHSLPVFF